MTNRPCSIDNDDFDAAVADVLDALLTGKPGARDRFVSLIAGELVATARSFLGNDAADIDDIVQESAMAVLEFVERRGGFTGNLARFSVTIARNRCRNILNWKKRWRSIPVDSLADWFADPGRSPLDFLEERDLWSTLHEVVDGLDPVCRDLLRALFLEEQTVRELRDRFGLTTVQGVYYRRDRCLQRAFSALQRKLSVCSPGRPSNEDGEGRTP